MGIMSFFKERGKRKEENNCNTNIFKNEVDCTLGYRSGINAEISFIDIKEVILDNGITKDLQEIFIYYKMPDGRFQGKKYFMEPIFDKERNNITKESYINIANSNRSLAKGFFAKEQIENEPTNYIGGINYNSQGKPFRGKDFNFEKLYKAMNDREKKEKEQANREKEAGKIAKLRDKVNELPCYIDENQPEDLSKLDCPYQKRSNSNEYTR